MMETATIKEKFDYAVQLIKNLPQSGNFEPSNNLKLKFYSYFKQATEGPCNVPKPAFWDIVSKAKWDAWNRLGQMAKNEAMEHYVDEFVEVIKVIPFDEKAYDLVNFMGPYIDFAPKHFREKHIKNGSIHNDNNSTDYNQNETNAHVNGNNPESDCEEYCDVFDQANEEFSDEERDIVSNSILNSVKQSAIQARGEGDRRSGRPGDSHSSNLGSSNRGNNDPRQARGAGNLPYGYSSNNPSGSSGGGRRNNPKDHPDSSSDVSEQLAFAVIRLQHTMDQVVSRLDSLEALLQEKKSPISFKGSTVQSSFSSVFGIPFHTALLILVWPFLTHWVVYLMKLKRRR